MRGFRWLTVVTMVGALLAMPVGAGADGGSCIVLDRTHYLPGGTAVGIAYVSVPERKQVLFERGPFYAFLVRKGDTILENHPVPESVIRVGTFSIEHEKGKSFELPVSLEDERTASTASSETRPLIDRWVVGLIILLALLSPASAFAIWRRRPAKIVVPDTIE